MNLKLLSGSSMLTVSGGWKADTEIRTTIMGNPVGAVLFTAVENAHDFLVAQLRHRVNADATLKSFNDDLTGLDHIFDRKSRSVYYGLEALAELTDDSKRAAFYRHVQSILFPIGLQVTRLSYRDEVGVALQIKDIATPELMAELEAIPFGPSTLADGLRAWLKAGEDLGVKLLHRDRMRQSLTKHGSATAELDPHGARLRWIRTVRALLAALEVMELSESFIEQFLAPLNYAVAQAERVQYRKGKAEAEADDSGAEAEADDSDAEAEADDSEDDLGDEIGGGELGSDDLGADDAGADEAPASA